MAIDIKTGEVKNTPVEEPVKDEVVTEENKDIESVKGLSDTEKKDPNTIKVTISDKDSPVVVLFGAAGCGKTMTMVRLSRYLRSQGYLILPDRVFRPSHDQNYKSLCDNFQNIINSDDAAERTDNISFMLLKVVKDGRTVCQILEGPGELYFDPDNAEQNWPTFFHTILNDTNLRKVFVPFVEPDFGDDQTRRNYVSTLSQLKTSAGNQKFIFLYNKVDKTPFVIEPGRVHKGHAMHDVESQYPTIFAPFRNTNPVTSFYRKYNFDFVPFQTGTYTQPVDGKMVYIEGSPRYPKSLWERILKCIRG